jgi:hypothetical protein
MFRKVPAIIENRDDVPEIMRLRDYGFEVEFSPPPTADASVHPVRSLLWYGAALGTYWTRNLISG